MTYSLYLLTVDSVPADPPYKVWFSTWSEDLARIEWTTVRPGAQDRGAKWVVIAPVAGAPVPPGATLLLGDLKDDPPPPFLQATKIESVGFKSAFLEVAGTPKGFSFAPS